MVTLKTEHLDKAFKLLAIIAIVITSLILTKDIVLPITFAALFSVVLLPIVNRIEKKNREDPVDYYSAHRFAVTFCSLHLVYRFTIDKPGR